MKINTLIGYFRNKQTLKNTSMKERYSTFIEYFKKETSVESIVSETDNSIALGIDIDSEPSYILTQTPNKTVSIVSESCDLFGNIDRLTWEFDQNMDQENMAEKVRSDVERNWKQKRYKEQGYNKAGNPNYSDEDYIMEWVLKNRNK